MLSKSHNKVHILHLHDGAFDDDPYGLNRFKLENPVTRADEQSKILVFLRCQFGGTVENCTNWIDSVANDIRNVRNNGGLAEVHVAGPLRSSGARAIASLTKTGAAVFTHPACAMKFKAEGTWHIGAHEYTTDAQGRKSFREQMEDLTLRIEDDKQRRSIESQLRESFKIKGKDHIPTVDLEPYQLRSLISTDWHVSNFRRWGIRAKTRINTLQKPEWTQKISPYFEEWKMDYEIAKSKEEWKKRLANFFRIKLIRMLGPNLGAKLAEHAQKWVAYLSSIPEMNGFKSLMDYAHKTGYEQIPHIIAHHLQRCMQKSVTELGLDKNCLRWGLTYSDWLRPEGHQQYTFERVPAQLALELKNIMDLAKNQCARARACKSK